VLRRAGYDVGTFTSPFLERYQNRIQYNLRDIEDDALVELAGRLKPLADELERTELGPPTMFELSTALAILYYATVVYPDYVVWETGLGGRLDSTNIVAPVATVITNIGRDHMDVLGDTIEQIAAEKAGIIKKKRRAARHRRRAAGGVRRDRVRRARTEGAGVPVRPRFYG